VIFASGLKYVGLNTTALGWVLCATLLGAAGVWLLSARPWRRELSSSVDVVDAAQAAANEPPVTPVSGT
jgi:hypothetical protein